MNSKILVAAGNTVTIDIEEYRRLVEHSTYLNTILSLADGPRAYILSDIISAVEGLINGSVIVIGGHRNTQEESSGTEASNEEAAHAE